MKKIIKEFWILALLLSVALSGYAYDFEVNGICYGKNSDGKTVYVTHKDSYYNLYSGSVVIPSTVTYSGTTYSVTSIGESAFKYCSGLTSVTIPNSVTSIGGGVFSGCSGLTSMTIPNSVTSIGDGAFGNCSRLKELTIQDGISTLSLGDNYSSSSFGGEGLFYDAPLESVFLGRNLSYGTSSAYGYSPFYGKSTIKELKIGNSVTSIGEYAFRSCSGLTSVKIPNSVTSIGISAFEDCTELTSVIFNAENCTTMGSSKYPVFAGCSNLTSLTIGESVKIIPSYAFYWCSGLTSVKIPNSVTSIGDGAFRYCSGLKSVTIPNSVTSIGNYAFEGCSLAKTFWLPNTPPSGASNVKSSVYYVANDQYSFSNQIKYQFLSSMFTVDGTVYVPVSPSERTCDVINCTYSPDDKSIVIKNKVINKGVELSVLKINPYSHIGNPFIENLSISYNGTIGHDAFQNCDALKSATVENCGSIGDYAFSGCTSLKTVTLGSSVTGIGDMAFYNCSSLDKIIVPDAVKTVGTSAFAGCVSLENASIGKGVLSLPQSVFSRCSSLPSLTIPNNVKSIGNYAFSGCTSLSDITIEDGEGYESSNENTVLNIGSNGSSPLFNDCPLDEVYIGRKLSYTTNSSAGYSPFYRNTSLRRVRITDAETQIYDNEFYGCSNLQALTIGNGVTTIGKWAFSGCSAMKDFSVGSKVESIGQEAFSDCTGLTSFYSYSIVPPTCGNQALDDINKWECSLYVPDDCISAYQAADQWKEFFFIYGGEEEMSIEDKSAPNIVSGVLRCDGVFTDVYTLSGVKVYSGNGEVKLEGGVYIVVANGHATKVMVK